MMTKKELKYLRDSQTLMTQVKSDGLQEFPKHSKRNAEALKLQFMWKMVDTQF